FAAALLATLAMRGIRDAAFQRGIWTLAAALTAWVTVKVALRPDAYFVGVFRAAALHVFDPEILETPILVLLAVTLMAYGLLCLALHRRVPRVAPLLAAVLVAGA